MRMARESANVWRRERGREVFPPLPALTVRLPSNAKVERPLVTLILLVVREGLEPSTSAL